jgi:hypothetical protein
VIGGVINFGLNIALTPILAGVGGFCLSFFGLMLVIKAR